jgi:cytoskeleton protein RodZ
MEDGGAGFFGGPVDDTPLESTTVESRPAGEPPADEPVTVVETAIESADALPMPEPQSELPSAALPREQEPAAAGQTRLSVRFSGDCWTEISDANDARLFFDMGRAGRSVELAGTAPFAILFGNSENVSLKVNGADYPISANTPGSRTARLTVLKP